MIDKRKKRHNGVVRFTSATVESSQVFHSLLGSHRHRHQNVGFTQRKQIDKHKNHSGFVGLQATHRVSCDV